MAKLRAMRVVDPTFLETAPAIGHLIQTIPASTEATFRCLEDPDSWPQWIGAITGVEWTSPRPFGVGTTRTVTIRPGGSIEEEFFLWEDGRRMSFYFTRCGLPFFSAFAEDYQLSPRGKDGCELRWSWAFEGAGLFRSMQPLLNAAFKRQGTSAMRALETYMRVSGAQYQ